MGWSVARPTGLTYHQRSLSTPGYTLFTPHGSVEAYLIDIQGRVVHRWQFAHIRPGYGRLLSNGNLLMTGSDVNLPEPPQDEPTKPPPPFERHVMRLGGYHPTLCEVSWDGEVVWEYVNPAQHHDFFRFPNGNTLVPEWVELPEDLHKRVRGGYKMPKERLPRLLGDDLVEIDRNLREVRRIHTWQLLDVREDRIRPQTRRWEWTHINGIDVNDAGDIVLSARNIDKLVRINHQTGLIDWKFDKTHGQHHPTFTAEGRVLVFDNGHDASRVVEIDTQTNEIVWEYSGSPAHQFFSGHISGACRLASGNVLVCEGTAGRLFEVNRERQVVWEFINPFSNRDRRGQLSVSVYRAHRYSVDHPALVDRDLDPARHRNFNSLHGLT